MAGKGSPPWFSRPFKKIDQSNDLLLLLDTDSKDKTKQSAKVSKQHYFQDLFEF